MTPADIAAYPGIPPHLHDGLIRFLDRGIEPGSFLTAVLENDLLGAIKHGDAEAIAGLPHIVKFLWNKCPGNAWGSPETVRAWRLDRFAFHANREAHRHVE